MNNIVLFTANRCYVLSSTGKELIGQFLASGWQDVLATAHDAESRALVDSVVILKPTVFNRGGFSPLADLLLFPSNYRKSER